MTLRFLYLEKPADALLSTPAACACQGIILILNSNLGARILQGSLRGNSEFSRVYYSAELWILRTIPACFLMQAGGWG